MGELAWGDLFPRWPLNLESKERAWGKQLKEKYSCPPERAKKTLIIIRCFWYLPNCQEKKLNNLKNVVNILLKLKYNRNLFIFIQRKLHVATRNISTAGKISRCWMFSQSFSSVTEEAYGICFTFFSD